MSLLSIDQDLARDSYYAATAPQGLSTAPLQGGVEADVAIVGGGLAGLSAAIELADRGHKVILLEAREVGGGASGRNGGQAIHGLACDQDTIEAELGEAEAKRIWDMVQDGLALVRDRIARFDIECEWQDGFLGLATSARKAAALRDWSERMQSRYGLALRWIDKKDLPNWITSPRYEAGVHDPLSGHLHPLKYTRGLARAALKLGVSIHEQSPVTAMEEQPGGRVLLRTAQGQVRAKQVLLAGNFYLQEIAPALAPTISARIMPVGTYIVCSEQMDAGRLSRLMPSRSAVCDTNFALDYFRPTADQRLLYGGGVSYSTATPLGMRATMRRRLLRSFPQLGDLQMQYAWGGFVDISMSRAPDFGRVGKSVYYLQGFSGHGLALTGLAGRLAAEAITGDAGRFDTFAKLKHRPFPGGRLLRMPALVLGTSYYRLKDMLS